MDVDLIDRGEQLVGKFLFEEVAFHSIRWAGDADRADRVAVGVADRRADRVQPGDRLPAIECVAALVDPIEFAEQLVALGDRVLGLFGEATVIEHVPNFLAGEL